MGSVLLLLFIIHVLVVRPDTDFDTFSETIESIIDDFANLIFTVDDNVNLNNFAVSVIAFESSRCSSEDFWEVDKAVVNKFYSNNGQSYNESTLFPLGTLSSLFTYLTAASVFTGGNLDLEESITYAFNQSTRNPDKGTWADLMGRMGVDDGGDTLTPDLILRRQSGVGAGLFDLYFADDVYGKNEIDMDEFLDALVKDATFPKTIRQPSEKAPPSFSEHAVTALAWAVSQLHSVSFPTQRKRIMESYATGATSILTLTQAQQEAMPHGFFYNSETEELQALTKRPIGTFFPANDIVAPVGAMTNLSWSLICNGKASQENGEDHVPAYLMSRFTSAQFTPQAAHYMSPSLTYGFRQLMVDKISILVADGDWPGWGSRLMIYFPENAMGIGYSFFLVYDNKSAVPRDAFTQFIVDKLINSQALDVTPSWNTRSSTVPNSKVWKGKYIPARTPRNTFITPWLRHFQIVSASAANNDITFAEYGADRENTLVEIARGIMAPKVPTWMPYYFSAFPDRSDPEFVVLGDSSLQRTFFTDTSIFLYLCLPALFVLCGACIVLEALLSRSGWKDKAAARASRGKDLLDRKAWDKEARSGATTRNAGRANEAFGLSGRIDDFEEEEIAAPVMRDEGPIDRVLTQTLIIAGNGGAIIFNATAFIISSALAYKYDEERAVFKYSVCGAAPMGAYAITAAAGLAALCTLAALALFVYQIVRFRKDTFVQWFIVVTANLVLALAVTAWEFLWNFFNPVPVRKFDCAI